MITHRFGEDLVRNRISETLRRFARGRLVLLLLAGMLLFNVFILPAQQAGLRATSGGTGPIDVLLFYTPRQVYSMVAAYGEAGRAGYRAFELTGDLLYPIVYSLFSALLITWLFRRGFRADSPLQELHGVPLVGWLFDLFENLSIVGMLSVYPATPAVLAWAAAGFTLLKWLFAGLSVLLILVGFAMALLNRLRKQPVTTRQV
jgi:hypothetical protein